MEKLVCTMHDHEITGSRLAKEAWLPYEYVNIVLNGYKFPDGVESQFTVAVQSLINKVKILYQNIAREKATKSNAPISIDSHT